MANQIKPSNRVTAKKLADRLINIVSLDSDRLEQIDQYHQGVHRLPYMPRTADAEYKMLAKRAITNMMPLVTGTCVQAMYVDAFRPGEDQGGRQAASTHSPQWDFWQRSRLDARQMAVYRDALAFGQVFINVYKRDDGRAIARSLSPLRTAALFRDPANDEEPYAVLTVHSYARHGDNPEPGEATMWDGQFEYDIEFDGDGIKVVDKREHGSDRCPVVRFAPFVDLEGRTAGIVEPLIPLNDRINQTVFDLLVAQTYSSFKVRFATGMAPPMETEVVEDPDTHEVQVKIKLDPNTGQPIPRKIDHNASRFLFAQDKDTRFGTLDETPLNGFIESVDMSIRQLSAIAQIPPHHLLGQIANLSAEALQAAEISLMRKVEEFQKSFGESWEQVFRVAAQIEGFAGADDMHAEVVWRDVSSSALSQVSDGLGKLAENLEIPRKGLWERVPGVSQGELDSWERLYAEDQAQRRAEAQMVHTLSSASTSRRPDRRTQAGTTEEE